MLRVATDIGGTFTDIAWCAYDRESEAMGEVAVWKTDTLPRDLTGGIMNAIGEAGLAMRDIGFFAHGTTVVINTLTQRSGVRTGLVTTAGFRDVLEIARGNRPDLFNFRFRKPVPFVPRHLRCEIDERVDHRGRIVRAPDLAGLEPIVERFRRAGVEAVAVCFLHAYANPANEAAVAGRLQALAPELSVIPSHRATREWREYERTSTAVLSAYVAPVVDRYLGALEERLGREGVERPPFVMQSNGGVAAVAKVRENPITLVESGPASGVLGAAALAAAMGRPNVIALDIGGTTAKCSLIADGKPQITTDYHIESDRLSPGYPIKTPVIDIVEIGTGGGSIAWLDEGGRLHVGPVSAGADPGPVIYGSGGTAPTVTDAHVLCGHIDVAKVLRRDSSAGLDAVSRAFAALGAGLGTDAEETARGVLRLADVNMEHALKLISINRGHDPREFTLVAYGGGGPLHGAALAAALRVPEVVVPRHASVFSAWGMLLTDVRRDFVQTDPLRLDAADPPRFQRAFEALEAEARAAFTESEAAGERILFERAADMRYRGQEHTVKVSLPAGPVDAAALERWAGLFRADHDRLYQVRLDVPVELVNFHLVAHAVVAKPTLSARPPGSADAGAACTGRRRIVFGETGAHEATIFDRDRLAPGMRVDGPAAVEERGGVTLIWPGQSARVDGFDNLVIRVEDRDGR